MGIRTTAAAKGWRTKNPDAVRIVITMPRYLFEFIQQTAVDERRSMSNQIVVMLEGVKTKSRETRDSA